MNGRETWRIALRNTFAFGRGYLSTFLSSLSMAGLVLAVSLLITVLSVMNGFDKEMRERILALVPHVTVYYHTPLADWQPLREQLAQHPGVTSVEPFVEVDALIMHGTRIETARGIGLDTTALGEDAALWSMIAPAQVQAFREDPAGLVLGRGVASRLGVNPGDQLTVLVPGGGDTLSARDARFEAVTLRGVLDSSTELDQSAAFLNLPLASRLAGHEGSVTGLRLSVRDLFGVSSLGWEVLNQLPPGFYTTNWMMTHGNLYSAIQLSRDLVTILLLSIIAVAAFNVVSSLVLVVFDKQGSIAILRTLGAGPRDIALLFVIQGGLIGLVGVGLGSLFGILLSLSVPKLVLALEGWLGFRFLDTDVYPVSFLPVDLLPGDILLVGGTALVMCLLAALYPALRAARLAPALILQQERA